MYLDINQCLLNQNSLQIWSCETRWPPRWPTFWHIFLFLMIKTLILVTNWIFFDIFSDIDDCSTNPCQNGGTCADGTNAYTCTCVTGFTGGDCETSKHVTLKDLIRIILKKLETNQSLILCYAALYMIILNP